MLRVGVVIVSALLAVGAQAAPGQLVGQRSSRPALHRTEECVGVGLPPVGDTTSGVFWAPIHTRLVIPPPLPDKYRNSVVIVRLRVNAKGRPDSIVVSGILDSAYAKQVRHALGMSLYRPAIYKGCAVVGWDSLMIR